MVIAVLGTVNAQMIATPRIALAMARQGIFPRWALKVNAGGTPTGALAITLAVALGFVLTGSYNKILGVDAFLVVAIYLIVFVSFFALRRKEPDTARPYRAPGYPWLPAGAVIFSVGILVAMALGDWKSAAVATASLLVCWPIGSRLARTARPASTD
jgi:APA family basic amino acid/polyamine antiporter